METPKKEYTKTIQQYKAIAEGLRRSYGVIFSLTTPPQILICPYCKKSLAISEIRETHDETG